MDGSDATDRGLRLSRRKVLIGGAAGAALWVVPTVESFAPVAAAGSAAPHPNCTCQGFTYLSLLVCDEKQSFYRCKFDLSGCNTGPGQTIPVDWTSCGYDFTNTPCYSEQSIDPTCYPGQPYISNDGPSELTGEYCVDEQGRTSLVVTNSGSSRFSLGAYLVNKHTTCGWGKQDQLTCTSTYQGPSGYQDSNGWIRFDANGGCATFPGVDG